MHRQISLSKFGFKNQNIHTSPVKNNNDRGRSEKRKITKNTYEAEKRCRTFVASWSKQFPGIEDTANRVGCNVCLGQLTKRRLDWMAIKYHLSFKTASFIRLHWGQVTFWGGQVDLIPICPTGQVTIKVSVYACLDLQSWRDQGQNEVHVAHLHCSLS